MNFATKDASEVFEGTAKSWFSRFLNNKKTRFLFKNMDFLKKHFQKRFKKYFRLLSEKRTIKFNKNTARALRKKNLP